MVVASSTLPWTCGSDQGFGCVQIAIGPAEEKQQRGQSTEIGYTAIEATVF